jgi:hypothetical protein
MNLDDLDTLICTLQNRFVRKAFIDEAVSWGHQPSEARHMHSSVMLELMRNYQTELTEAHQLVLNKRKKK